MAITNQTPHNTKHTIVTIRTKKALIMLPWCWVFSHWVWEACFYHSGQRPVWEACISCCLSRHRHLMTHFRSLTLYQADIKVNNMFVNLICDKNRRTVSTCTPPIKSRKSQLCWYAKTKIIIICIDFVLINWSHICILLASIISGTVLVIKKVLKPVR